MSTENETRKPSTKKVMEASVNFLERRGYEILEQDNKLRRIICRDEDTIVFCWVASRVRGDAFPEDLTFAKRRKYEQQMIAWSVSPEGLNVLRDGTRLRMDTISMIIIADDKTLIRHHISAWDPKDSVEECDAKEKENTNETE